MAGRRGQRDDVAGHGRVAAALRDPGARGEVDEVPEQEVGRDRVDAQHRRLEDVGRRIDPDGAAVVDQELVLPGAVDHGGNGHPLADAFGIDTVTHAVDTTDALGAGNGGQGRAVPAVPG